MRNDDNSVINKVTETIKDNKTEIIQLHICKYINHQVYITCLISFHMTLIQKDDLSLVSIIKINLRNTKWNILNMLTGKHNCQIQREQLRV